MSKHIKFIICDGHQFFFVTNKVSKKLLKFMYTIVTAGSQRVKVKSQMEKLNRIRSLGTNPFELLIRRHVYRNDKKY